MKLIIKKYVIKYSSVNNQIKLSELNINVMEENYIIIIIKRMIVKMVLMKILLIVVKVIILLMMKFFANIVLI